MAMIQRPKGTADMLPAQAYKWHTIEKLASETAEQYGFREIRVPAFEETGLFLRSVGETTDVVQKEMYTVTATGDSEFTLRPEGTAGVMRAVIENGLLNEAFPQKVYYLINCFRHENVQKGRLREFHQFGCEMVGSADAKADADVISMAKSFMDRIGLRDIELNINSIGCPTCRAKYQQALRDYFGARRDELCDTCKERLEKNPMRLLDCKSPICKEIGKNAPLIIDYLCDECSDHFEKLKKYLGLMGIDFVVNPKIVRGLDYYTRTVFEFISKDIGAQGTVCGGGRYDGLIEELSGKAVPALGFAMGIERLILTMEAQNCDFMEEKTCDLYIASMGDEAVDKSMELAMKLRDEGFFVEYDLMGRGIKPQMKYAGKIGAKFVLVIGSSELETGCAKLKNMASGEQADIKLDDSFVDNFSNALMAEMFKDIDGEMAALLGKE
ncbi:histidine--tRNA ligase [Ruminococcus albus]|uniref:Histidine--tRNA ligase n=1 Tax=Ruminococcus albus TaxID=1264 RepID=A0A1I1Q9C9_RUMAL|nr:histidine--tRNA ligase [Ruminococcus albus]SFD14720.1 histidyl-tRNA synthetase [Ruminococcus albus]